MEQYLLQQYENRTYGYLGIDGDENNNFTTGYPVICTQGKNESRADFIIKNGLTFKPNQYGFNEELDKQVNSEIEDIRLSVAEQGYGLDKLINDKYWKVRKAVAEQGYGLDKLVNDEHKLVRSWVAYYGYGLDKLINDEYFSVRENVASHGYGLDKLVYDECWTVREEVAKQGYGLAILVNDENRFVRYEVVRLGYGLDRLINDKDEWVRKAAEDYLKHNRLTLEEWKKQNGIIDTTDLVKDFIYKIDDSNKLDIQIEFDSIDEFFSEPISGDAKLDTLTIYTVNTKVPLVKLEKVNNSGKKDYRFIVDITTNDGDNFSIKTIIKSQEQLSQQIEQTVEALRQYKQFAKYADDLEDCL